MRWFCREGRGKARLSAVRGGRVVSGRAELVELAARASGETLVLGLQVMQAHSQEQAAVPWALDLAEVQVEADRAAALAVVEAAAVPEAVVLEGVAVVVSEEVAAGEEAEVGVEAAEAAHLRADAVGAEAQARRDCSASARTAIGMRSTTHTTIPA